MTASTAEKPKTSAVERAVDEVAEALGMIDTEPQDVFAGDDEGLPPTSGPLQLSMTPGGKKATVSGMRLMGGKVDVDGTYSKGTTVELRVLAVVGEVAFVDQTDAKTGQVVGCERRHKARITEVTVL